MRRCVCLALKQLGEASARRGLAVRGLKIQHEPQGPTMDELVSVSLLWTRTRAPPPPSSCFALGLAHAPPTCYVFSGPKDLCRASVERRARLQPSHAQPGAIVERWGEGATRTIRMIDAEFFETTSTSPSTPSPAAGHIHEPNTHCAGTEGEHIGRRTLLGRAPGHGWPGTAPLNSNRHFCDPNGGSVE